MEVSGKIAPISVLFADDNASFLRIATRFLREHEGNQVNVMGTAQGGEEALAKAQELQPDVVLVDLAMPDIPGLELIPLLRTALPDVGIIVVTMHDTDSYRQAALNAGADAFVSKAVLNDDLIPTIRRVTQENEGGRRPENLKHNLS